jgi:hypothetical protein
LSIISFFQYLLVHVFHLNIFLVEPHPCLIDSLILKPYIFFFEGTLELLVPLIASMSRSLLEQNNPWTASKLSKGERGDDCRETLRKLLRLAKRVEMDPSAA